MDGVIAGTPFYVALVPGYLAYLWQQAVLMLRTAALYGRDPRERSAAAEMLVMCGVHATIEQAVAAVTEISERPLPDRPTQRRSVGVWGRSLGRVLVLGGFLPPPGDPSRYRGHGRLVVAVGVLVGLAVTWVLTAVFPVTLMALMALRCEQTMRGLGHKALALYGGVGAEAALAGARQERSRLRRALHFPGLLLSVAAPIVWIAYADRLRRTVGINALDATGALVALSLVIAVTVRARRK